MPVRTGGGPVHVRSSQRFPQIHPEQDPRFDVPRFSHGDAGVFASRRPDCPGGMKRNARRAGLRAGGGRGLGTS